MSRRLGIILTAAIVVLLALACSSDPTPAPTATSVPPTATAVPATATPTPVVEVDEGGFPVWAIIVIVLAVIAGVAIIGFVVYRRRQV